MRVLVCGGRRFSDAQRLGAFLGGLEHHAKITAIIHGGATGADYLAGKYAEWRNVDTMVFPAEWDLHGKAAGPLRNQRMLDEGKPDVVISFPGGKGTADMIRRAKAAGIPVREG
jgi:hypothetical protein